ncbi:MAG: hypothetical protein ACREQA_16400 [Candidatus Binatia bacterium]
MVDATALRRLDERLAETNMEGLWVRGSEEDMATYSKDPHTTVLPHLWKWEDIHESIRAAGEIHGLEGMAERRVIRLVNPAFKGQKNKRQRTTTHTMLMTVQLLKPGEVANSHRHNFAAFRSLCKVEEPTPS